MQGAQGGEEPSPKRPPFTRWAGILILTLVAAYVVAILAGLSKERRIDAASLGIVGIGALAATILFRPDILERVTRLEVAGWKLEIEKRQEKQHEQLNDIELILPILLPREEQKHLLNLASGNTGNYKANHNLRTELRRLRSLKLIKMLPDKDGHDREIGQMKDEMTVDIGQFVALTPLGQRWVDRIKEIDAEKSTQAKNAIVE